jgi:hypothetical protein
MVKQSGWTGYNCTEGGTLFGEGIEWMALDAFIQSCSAKSSGPTKFANHETASLPVGRSQHG